jgi:hypothetical protein
MRSRRLAIGFIALLGLAVGVSLMQSYRPAWSDADDDQDPAGNSARVRVGLRIAPVKLTFRGRNRAMVGLGSYLVNAVGSCNDCHTCPSYASGHDPYQGQSTQVDAEHYLAGGVQFGPFVSRNITPDANGLPAGVTLEGFIHAIRTGHDSEPPHDLLQVMPWPVLANMTDRDLTAIYTYLSAIPHAEPGVCGGPGAPLRR